VSLHYGDSYWFDVITGDKQGCVLSPLLFGIAIDWLVVQVVRACRDMQHVTEELAENGEKVGLCILA